MDASALAFDANGLVTVVVQDRITGEVRMVAHADQEAIARTLSSGEGWFWSRSRKALWKKGETSGNVLRVHGVWVDCDRDVVVYLADPAGPSCHTGAESCFFERALGSSATRALPLVLALEEALASRVRSTADKSYTKSLLDRGAARIHEKIMEEAGELGRALEGESDERVVSEAADVLYHLMVGLLHRGIPVRAVLAELARRFGTSGHDEKASRTRSA